MDREVQLLWSRALARAGFADAADDEPIDNPIVRMAEGARLTLVEYEAVVMSANGLTARAIGKMSWPRRTEKAVDSAERRGIRKLRAWLLSAGIEAARGPLVAAALPERIDVLDDDPQA